MRSTKKRVGTTGPVPIPGVSPWHAQGLIGTIIRRTVLGRFRLESPLELVTASYLAYIYFVLASVAFLVLYTACA